MIPNHFPVVNPLTTPGVGEYLLQNWHRQTAFKVLAATSRGLRATFYKHSWRTRAVTETEQSAMVRFFKEVTVQVHAPIIECVFFFLT